MFKVELKVPHIYSSVRRADTTSHMYRSYSWKNKLNFELSNKTWTSLDFMEVLPVCEMHPERNK